MMFEYDDEKSGEEYGIQVYGEYLVKILRVMFQTIKYHKFPFTSHSGTTFNLVDIKNLRLDISSKRSGSSKEKILLVFRTKFWTSEFNENGGTYNYEDRISVEQKKRIKMIIKKSGLKIVDAWNDEVACSTMSIVVDVPSKYKDKDCNKIELKKYIDVMNTFDITREDE